MSRNLGEAFVSIRADFGGFTADLRTKLKAAITGTNANIPVSIDQVKLDASIAAAKAKISALNLKGSNIQIDASVKTALAKIAQLQAVLTGLSKEGSDLQITADTKAAQAKILALKLQAMNLAKAMEEMPVGLQTEAADAKLSAIFAQIKLLQFQVSNVNMEMSTAAVTAQITAVTAQIEVLKKQAANIALGLDTAAVKAQIAVLEAQLAVLTEKRTIDIDVDTSKLLVLKSLLNTIFVGGSGGGGSGGGSGGLFAGFNGFGRILNTTILGVKAWHLALSLSLETLIAVGTAAAAAAVGVAAMAPAAKEVALQLQSIDTINETMGNQIPSLTRDMDGLTKAMAPQTVEAFGGAMNLLKGNFGAISQTAHVVVNMFDTWIAELDIWSKSQGGFGGILQAGVKFLGQFASAIGHVLSALDNLAKADPGTAHILLDIINGFAKVLDWVSKLPQPILEMALAWHAFYIYGIVAVNLLAKMPGLLGIVGKALAGLGGWQLAGLAALAAIAFEIARAWGTASKQVASFISSIESSLNSLNGGDALTAIPQKLGELNSELNQVKAQGIGPIIKGWNSGFLGLSGTWQEASLKIRVLGSDLSGMVHGSVLHELDSVGAFFRDWTKSGGQASEAVLQEKQDIALLNSEINKLLGSQRNLDNETGQLIKSGFNYNQALALMNLAGVKWNDTAAVMAQKVQNLIAGFKDMSVQGGILNNSVNAITFATQLQSTKVSQLNSSWDTFIKTVTDGLSTLDTYSTDLTSLGTAFKAAKGDTSGLTASSVALQQAFTQTVVSANAQVDALQVMATAAGLGSKGTTLLTKSVQDMVAEQLPAARGSAVLTAQLYALAQRGGYQGADSFKALAQWVKNVQNPMKDLQGNVSTLTVASAGLTGDVQNLSKVLGTTLTGAMAQAVFLASGGQATFTAFAKAVLTSGGNISKMQGPADSLIHEMIAMTGNVAQTKTEFLAFAQGALGLSAQKANALWNAYAAGDKPTRNVIQQNAQARAAVGAFGKQAQDTAKQQAANVPIYRKAWDDIYGATVGAAVRIGHNVEAQWDGLRHSSATQFDNIRHDVATAMNNVYGATVGVAIRIGHNVETQWDSLRHGTATQFDNIRHDIASIWGNIGSFFATWWGSTKKFFSNMVGDIAGIISRIWDAIFGRVKNAWGGIGSFFATWWGNTKKFFTNMVDDIATIISRIWDAIFGRVKNAWGGIGNFFANWWGNTKKFFSNVLNDIANILSRIWDAIFGRVKNAWGGIGNFFANWWGSTKKFFSNAVGDVGTILSKGWDSVYNTVKSKFGAVGNFFATWWGSTEKFIGNAVDSISLKIAKVWSDIKDVTKILWNAIGGFMGAGINAGKAALKLAIQGAEVLMKPLVTGYNAVRHIWNGAKVVWGALGFAQGGQVGKVMQGTGPTADDVVVRVSKNETILSAAHSKILDKAGVLGGLGVPGYAKGGIPGYEYGGDPYNPRSGDAPAAVKVMSSQDLVTLFRQLGVTGYAAGGNVTGAQIASDAERWQGHKYVWGGAANPTTGWDCSSFAGYILGHDFGFKLPGGVSWNPNVHGPTANEFTGEPGFGLVSHNTADIQAGDLLVENSGGHVGFGVGPNRMFSAYDTASGTIFSNAQNMTEILRIGKGVKLGAGALPGSGPGGGGAGLSAADVAAYNAYVKLLNKDISTFSVAGIGKAVAAAVTEAERVAAAVAAHFAGTTDYNLSTGTVASNIKPAIATLFNAAQAAASAGSGGNGPAGVGGSAGEMANGTQIYQYLLKNLFGGNKIAAAGATASIWGESTWNPFAQGSGGRGLIGWTPASTISNADFSGGMKTQLPAILRFVTSSGDSGTISQMFRATSILQAANEWGHGVERFGINDVHSQGLALAKQIAGLKAGGKVGSYDSGGWLPPGVSTAVNNTGQSERISAPGTLTAGERAILAELRAIKIATQNAPVSFGRTITGGVARGAARGYYGS